MLQQLKYNKSIKSISSGWIWILDLYYKNIYMLNVIKYVIAFIIFVYQLHYLKMIRMHTVKSKERAISPIIQIRYDNFANENFSPSSAIGMILKIDENRFTGFDVNTSDNETRIIMGWKWSILGLAVSVKRKM